MKNTIGRRGFMKSVVGAGCGAGLLAGHTAQAQEIVCRFPAGITREDLVHLVEGPWRRLRAVIEQKVVDMHTHPREFDDSGLTKEDREKIMKVGEIIDYSDLHVRDQKIHGVAAELSQRSGLATSTGGVGEYGYERYYSALTKHSPRLMEVVDARPYEQKGDVKGALAHYRRRLQAGARCITIGAPEFGRDYAEQVKAVAPVMEVAAEFDVPVYMGTGNTELGSPYTREPETLSPFVRAFPKNTFVMGDGGGKGYMTPGGWQAVQMLSSWDNLYASLDGATIQYIEEAVKAVGPTRLCFSSDLNYPYLREYRAFNSRDMYQRYRVLNAIALADLTEDQRDLILYKNARRLLKLDEKPYAFSV
jgi:predicted TIM-barrel fold metal-dependent hydrolase